MKPNYTHIAILVDRSGSMQSIQKDMELGLKSFIEQQKTVPGECTFSLADFDTEYVEIFNFAQLNEFNYNLKPRGGTALIDSMVRLIDSVGQSLAEKAEDERPEKVLFITITDGEENSSCEFSSEDLKKRIQTQENDYKWQFVYLGANQDAFSVAGKYGISNLSAKSRGFVANDLGVQDAFEDLILSTKVYRSAAGGASANFEFKEKNEEGKKPVDPKDKTKTTK